MEAKNTPSKFITYDDWFEMVTASNHNINDAAVLASGWKELSSVLGLNHKTRS